MLAKQLRLGSFLKSFRRPQRAPALRTSRLRVMGLEERAVPATIYTVTSEDDMNLNGPGQGSGSGISGDLRYCMLNAGALDEIHFLSTLSPVTPNSALPTITVPLIIDGSTSTITPNILDNISLDGSSAGAGINGLQIALSGSGSVIKNLDIVNFRGDGIQLQNGTMDCTIRGCNITISGQSGIDLLSGSSNNMICGNVVGANAVDGISLGASANGNLIQGNMIGLEGDGSFAQGNTDQGINLTNASGNSIAGNHIGGNGQNGILISGISAANNKILGNWIGIDPSGLMPVGNIVDGIQILSAPDTTIGGFNPGESNEIAGNGQYGVTISGASAIQNVVRGNSIHNHTNTNIGIHLVGGNLSQPSPTIITAAVSATSPMTVVSGSCSAGSFTLDFYANNAPGTGEGRTYLGSALVSSGTFTNVVLPGATTGGEVITATATDSSGNTSPFSSGVIVPFPTNLPPRVASVVVNGGSAQRSMVTSITVTFNQNVGQPLASAFQLLPGPVTLNAVDYYNSSGLTVVTLTFPTLPCGLDDGFYTLTVLQSQVTSNSSVHLDGNSNGVADGAGDDYILVGNTTNGLFRTFGDWNGNGYTDAQDLADFHLYYGGGSLFYDFNCDGVVSSSDYTEFRNRYRLVVTNTNDHGCGSLRDNIDIANANKDSNTITFQIPGPVGPHTIALNTGQLNVVFGLTIDGSTVPNNCDGDQIIINQTTPNARVLNVNTGVGGLPATHYFTANEVTFQGGNLISDNGAGLDGAGLRFNSADTVTLERVRVIQNTASSGRGGGIAFMGDAPGSLTLNGCEIGGNTAQGASGLGGGIFNNGTATVRITDSPMMGACPQMFSDIHNNTADQSGGGIYNHGIGGVTIEHNSKIRKNLASAVPGVSPFQGGGGIYNLAAATINVNNSTISGNATNGHGGGLYTASNSSVVNINRSTISFNVANTAKKSNGGGLSVIGTITIFGSDILSNTSKLQGGGIYYGAGTKLDVQQSKIELNVSSHLGGGIAVTGPMTIQDSSVTGNTAMDAGGGLLIYGDGNLFDNLHQIENSTISSNQATGKSGMNAIGGGIFLSGILDTKPTLKLYNCTVSNNSFITKFGNMGSGIYNAYVDGTTQNLEIYSTIVITNFLPKAVNRPNVTIYGNVYADHSLFFDDAHTLVIPGSQFDPNFTADDENLAANPKNAILASPGANITSNQVKSLSPQPPITNGLPIGSPKGWSLSQRPINTNTVSHTYIYGMGSNPLNLPTDQRNFTGMSGLAYSRIAGVTVSGVPRDFDIGALEDERTNFNHRSLGDVQVISLDASPVFTGGATMQSVVVTFLSDLPIDPATIDSNDLLITGPDGTQIPSTAIGVAGGNGVYDVTYQFTPPGGNWDYTDNGQYRIQLQGDQVSDTGGNVAQESDLGSIQIIVSTVFVVTNTNDGGPGSLREAIAAANASEGTTDTITFDPTVFSSAKTITLTGDSLVIDDPLTINGPGAGLLSIVTSTDISGTPHSRVFDIQGYGNMPVAISGLSLSGAASENGGVLRDVGAVLTVDSCTLIGIGAGPHAVNGGAISLEFSAGTESLTLQNSTVSGFRASGNGGAINLASGATALFVNSTMSDNAAGSAGGALALDAGSTATLKNSTLAFNTAASGGGIANNGGTATIASTIVGKNNATTGPDISGVVSADHSLIGNSAGATVTGANNVLDLDPLLGPLANNGGPTQTHALLTGSPALSKGSNPDNLQFDQRGTGFFRNAGGQVDIGAVESQFPARLVSVVINDGSAQRSRVTSMTLAFDQLVMFTGATETAFDLVRQSDSKHPPLLAAVDNTGPGTVVMLTFGPGDAVDFGSLADGRYTLTIDANKVSNSGGPLDGNGDGTGGDNYTLVGDPATNKLFRLYGDVTGDGTVSASDFIVFRQYFGGYLFALDFDNDGAVAASDFIQFRLRFGGSI